MSLLPEEQELARLEGEQTDLEEKVVSGEVELETIRNETFMFQRRYYREVGRLYAKLDELNAQIAKMRSARKPDNVGLRARANSAREQARQSSEEAGLIEEEPTPPPVIDPDLKKAYRQAAKLMHPDLALSESERQRRTKLMAALNHAYEHSDLKEIERIVTDFGQDPEAIIGDDIGSRIVKTEVDPEDWTGTGVT